MEEEGTTTEKPVHRLIKLYQNRPSDRSQSYWKILGKFGSQPNSSTMAKTYNGDEDEEQCWWWPLLSLTDVLEKSLKFVTDELISDRTPIKCYIFQEVRNMSTYQHWQQQWLRHFDPFLFLVLLCCGVEQSGGTNALITFAPWLNNSELYESFLCVSFKTAEKMKLSKDASLLCLCVSLKPFDEKESKLTGDVGLVELVEYKQLELGGLGVLDTPCHCCHPSSNFFVSSSFLSSQLKCLWFLLL